MTNLKRRIENPCDMQWNKMMQKDNEDKRFCGQCRSIVYDVTKLEDVEIEKLWLDNDKNICVRALSTQLTQTSYEKSQFAHLWKKAQFLGIVFLASLISQDVSAQTGIRKPDSYKITQNKIISDSITINGVVKQATKFRYKKADKAWIRLYSQENLLVGEFRSESNGTFEIVIDRKVVGEQFTISIVSLRVTLEVKDIESKDTKFKFFLKKPERIVSGRFF